MLTTFAMPLALSCMALVSFDAATASTFSSRRSAISDPFTTPARLLHGLHQRDLNMTLTDSLLAVLSNTTTTSTSTARDVDSSSTYEGAITSNAANLDNLFGQSTARGISNTTRASLACAASKLVFGSDTITPQSTQYTTEVEENWSPDCWLTPACILKPRNSIEVALGLAIVNILQATFAVRSGGHNPNPGAGGVGSEGILIDLGALNTITLSKDKTTVSVGPGATWDVVYGILEKYDLVAVGGRSAGVGVGGLLLGGGMSHFSNYWGLACDNIVSYEVVLANSQIITVSATENSDLFKALKGGGPNFGIVTNFVINTFAGSQLWYEFITFNASDAAAVMAAAVQVEENMLTDNKLGFFLSDAPGTITAGLVYRAYTDKPAGFQPFFDLTPLVVALPATNGTFTSCAIAASLPNGPTWQIGALTVATNASLYVQLHDILAAFPANPNISLGYTYQPFSEQGVTHGVSNGGNSLNIASQNQAWLAFACSWTDASLQSTAVAQVTSLMSQISAAAKAKGELLALEYMNDSNYLQSPITSYGAASVAYLKKISKKYDPTGFFQKFQNGGFLLRSA